MLVSNPQSALLISVAVTLVALFIFGYIKGRFTTPRPFRSALETALGWKSRRWRGIFDCKSDLVVLPTLEQEFNNRRTRLFVKPRSAREGDRSERFDNVLSTQAQL